MALVGLWEHKSGTSVPWVVYGGLLVFFFFVACFLAFKDQFALANGLQADLSKAIDTADRMRFASDALDDLKRTHEVTTGSLDELRVTHQATTNELNELKTLVPAPFPFTASQRASFIAILSGIPTERRFDVVVKFPGMGGGATPARLFAKAVQESGWNAKAQSSMMTNPNLQGVVLCVSHAVAENRVAAPDAAAIFMTALRESGVPVTVAIPPEQGPDSFFELIVAEP